MFGTSDDTSSKIIVALVTALLGGLVVAVFNWLITRKKTAADIELARLSADKLKLELQGINNSIREVSAKISQGDRIIYDGTAGMSGFDFKGRGERFFGEDESRPIGEGNLSVEDNIMKVARHNTGGRYRIILQNYLYDSTAREYLPKNPALEGKRKLKISCEARTSAGIHNLSFALKRREDGRMFERTERVLVNKEWRGIVEYVRIDAIDDVLLWIEDQGVSDPDSILYLRKLMLVESSN
jgi:hypothetical protein